MWKLYFTHKILYYSWKINVKYVWKEISYWIIFFITIKIVFCLSNYLYTVYLNSQFHYINYRYVKTYTICDIFTSFLQIFSCLQFVVLCKLQYYRAGKKDDFPKTSCGIVHWMPVTLNIISNWKIPLSPSSPTMYLNLFFSVEGKKESTPLTPLHLGICNPSADQPVGHVIDRLLPAGGS